MPGPETPRRAPLAPRPPRSRRRKLTYRIGAAVVVLWALAVGIVLVMGLRDASHAMAEEAVLVTSDRAFSRVPGLSVEDWLAA